MLKKIAAALVALLCTASGGTSAQTFPSRAISLAITVGPNSAYYHLMRRMADQIQAKTAVSIVFDPLLGANGNLGPAKVKRSKPDGHTITLTFASPLTMNPLLWKDKLFDPLRDFACITLLTQHGIASTGGLVGLLQIEDAAGVKFFKVPYKTSGQFDAALLSGEIDMSDQAASTTLGLLKAGRMKALFIGSTKRSPILPNVQSISEVPPNIEVTSWCGLIASAGTPAERINWHVREWGAVLREPKIADRLVNGEGYEIVGSTPQAFADQVRRELAANQRTIEKHNIKE